MFSHCKIITGFKPTESTFLTERTYTKANNMYRFKLNWLILIAFNIYHTADPKNQRQLLIDICEFVDNLYKIFVGWMMDMEAESLRNEFMPKTAIGQTYIMKTSALITKESTDGSLTILREAIRDKLCEIGQVKERISAAKAAEAAKAAAKLPASSPASSRSSSRSASPESRLISSGNINSPVGEALEPPPLSTTSPLIRRIKGINPKTQVEQEAVDAEAEAEAVAVAEEARKKFAAEDAAVAAAAAKRPSRGNVVTNGPWKNPIITSPKEDPPEFVRKPNQEHSKYEEELARAAAAGQQSRKDKMNSRLVEAGPSYGSLQAAREAARAREIAKSNIPTPPTTGSPTPGRFSRTRNNPLFGSVGGNKQRTRKRQRIASTHHHTKRRILRNKNHKHTRKARLTRASVSV